MKASPSAPLGSIRALEGLFREADTALWGSAPGAQVLERGGLWALARPGNPFPLAACRLSAGTMEELRSALAAGEDIARQCRLQPIYRVVRELLPPGAHEQLKVSGFHPLRSRLVMALRQAPRTAGLRQNPRVCVRPAGGDDADFIASAIVRGLGLRRQRSAAFRGALPVVLRLPSCPAFVAEVDGTKVAANLTVRVGDTCVLAYAATRPGWQGQGVATTMFLEILRFLSQSGVVMWVAAVDPYGTARGLNDRLGFTPEYDVETYVRPRGAFRWLAKLGIRRRR